MEQSAKYRLIIDKEVEGFRIVVELIGKDGNSEADNFYSSLNALSVRLQQDAELSDKQLLTVERNLLDGDGCELEIYLTSAQVKALDKNQS